MKKMSKIQTPYGLFEVEVNQEIAVNGEIGWRAVYTVGDLGMKQGGSIKIILPAYQHQRSREYVQVYDYWKPHFLYAYCNDETLPIRTAVEKVPSKFSHIQRWVDSDRVAVIIAEADLPPGSQIYIHYGGIDRAWMEGQVPPTRVGHRSTKREGSFLKHECLIDIEGTKEYKKIDIFPEIKVVPGEAKYLTLIAPTFIQPKEPVEIKYLVKDRFHNPIFDWKGAPFTINMRNLQTGKQTPCPRNERGTYEIRVEEEGIYELDIAGIEELEVQKAVFFCKESEYQIYWGDLHCHSSLTPNIRDNNGGASPYDAYQYAKEVSNIDFVGLSEQTFEFNEDEDLNITRSTWDTIGALSDEHYIPGSFVTFPGFEFHSQRGDTIVLFGDSLSKFPYPDETVQDLPDVWTYYGEDQYLTIPHLHRYCGGRRAKDQQEMQHTGFTLDNWKAGNKKQEVLCEIYSSQWGRFESNDHPMLLKAKANVPKNTYVDFLNMGKPWGVTASSDDHDAMPGYGGVTAVYAKELTREGIFEALRSRRTYATTHPRIGVQFYVNGLCMGEEAEIGDGEAREIQEIRGQVICPKEIQYVEIIKNGELLQRIDGDQSWMDISYEDIGNIKERTYYYLRVKQIDGHFAWSSPIWIIPK